jgi:RND family efflux transporter MFP subunit
VSKNNETTTAAPQGPSHKPRGPRGFARVRRLVRFLPLPIIVLVIGFFAYSALVASKPETVPTDRLERVWVVESMVAKYQTVIPVTAAFGELRARRQVDLRALVAGEVVKTNPRFEDGVRVAKGDVLAEIDDFTYQLAVDDATAQLSGSRAILTEREAAADHAKREMDRAKTLFEKGTVSKKTLDDLTLQYAVNTSRFEQQKSTVDRDKVRLARAERDLKNTKIIAPFDAHVSNIAAREGRVLSSNDRVASLTGADDFEVVFNLTDDQYGRLLARNTRIIGRRLKVFWDIGGQRMTLSAQIRHVGATISQATRGADVYAQVDGQIPSNLRSGAFVTVEMAQQAEPDVVAVPKYALYGDNQIYVIEEGRLVPLLLTDYLDDGDRILVKSGLRNGQTILLTQFNEAAAGVAVKTLEAL